MSHTYTSGVRWTLFCLAFTSVFIICTNTFLNVKFFFDKVCYTNMHSYSAATAAAASTTATTRTNTCTSLWTAMHLSRLYFCYGAVLTSVLWMSVILIYFSIPGDQQMSMSPPRAIVVNQLEEQVPPETRTNSNLSASLLPDLDQLSIIGNIEDKQLRAEGKYMHRTFLLSHCCF